MKMPKLIVSDIDGVWTDGSMYYDNQNNELKRFCTYDGAGVRLAQQAGIPVAVITGEKTQIVRRRAEKLKVSYVFQGISDKVCCLRGLLDKLSLNMENVAYIGDDLNDYNVMSLVGLSACPSNAHYMIKRIANWELTLKGGEGVFREFVERIFRENKSLDEIIRKVYNID